MVRTLPELVLQLRVPLRSESERDNKMKTSTWASTHSTALSKNESVCSEPCPHHLTISEIADLQQKFAEDKKRIEEMKNKKQLNPF